MTIKEILEKAIRELNKNNIEESITKSRILLAYTIGKQKEYLISHDEEEVKEEDTIKYKDYITRLINNEPIQYIIQNQEFMGLNLYVDKNVLVPRADTEIIVEEVLNIVKKYEKIKILDLCTGSGAIAVALAKNIENPKIIATDISKEALEVANMNIQKYKLEEKVKIIHSDLFNSIEKEFDIIVTNPPYIKTNIIKTLDKEVQREPKIALDGGEDGLQIYIKIILEAYKYLKEAGYLCLEIGYDQKEDVIKLLKNSNKYKDIYSKKDLAGRDRIIICKKGRD